MRAPIFTHGDLLHFNSESSRLDRAESDEFRS